MELNRPLGELEQRTVLLDTEKLQSPKGVTMGSVETTLILENNLPGVFRIVVGDGLVTPRELYRGFDEKEADTVFFSSVKSSSSF